MLLESTQTALNVKSFGRIRFFHQVLLKIGCFLKNTACTRYIFQFCVNTIFIILHIKYCTMFDEIYTRLMKSWDWISTNKVTPVILTISLHMECLLSGIYFIHDVYTALSYIYNSEIETRLDRILNKAFYSIDCARDIYINQSYRINAHSNLYTIKNCKHNCHTNPEKSYNVV